MVRFSKLSLDADGNPVETDIREISQADMAACPHFIMVADHYRQGGRCRCDDATHTEMKEWGYKWNGRAWA